MSNSQSFNFSSLKEMSIDCLISKCTVYVEQYLSKSAATRLGKAYKENKYDEVKYILEKTLNQIRKKTNDSEYQKAKKAVMDMFPDADDFFVSFDNNEGGKKEMGIGSIIAYIILAIIVVAIISTLIYLKLNKKTVGEVLPTRTKNVTKPRTSYTEKDRDLICLIHELSIIYDNTDKYLNS